MYVCSPQHSWHCAQDEDGKFIHDIVSFSKSLLCTHVNNLHLLCVSITVETYEHLVSTKKLQVTSVYKPDENFKS